MAEHKHAAVLRAIADRGYEAAEFRPSSSDTWIAASQSYNPMTSAHFEWRIKPEPKPDRVFYNMVRQDVQSGLIGAEHYRPGNGHNMRYVFDGETGKLKSAEVLP